MKSIIIFALLLVGCVVHASSANALVVLGDIDNDGVIGLGEAIHALRVVAGEETGGMEIFSTEFLVGKTLYVVVGEAEEIEIHEVAFLTTDTLTLDGRSDPYEILEGGVLKIHNTYQCEVLLITPLQAFDNYIFASYNGNGSIFLFYDRTMAEDFAAPINASACNPESQASLITGSPACGGGEVNYGSTVYLRNFHDNFSVRATIQVVTDISTGTFEETVAAGEEVSIGCTMQGTDSRDYSIIDAVFVEP
ncbi:MAG: hypothetical protein IH591_04480 [Bacteroidales bacterium]|nr:hypothetical protein [Bacteroidales bacterium]